MDIPAECHAMFTSSFPDPKIGSPLHTSVTCGCPRRVAAVNLLQDLSNRLCANHACMRRIAMLLPQIASVPERIAPWLRPNGEPVGLGADLDFFNGACSRVDSIDLVIEAT